MLFGQTPTASARAHVGWCTAHPNLLLFEQQRGWWINIEGDSQGMRDRGVLDWHFPGQKYLGAILPDWKVRRVENAAMARNDGVGLAGIENHNRPLTNGIRWPVAGK